MTTRSFGIALVILFAYIPLGHARWATREDAESEIEFENSVINVNSNGTYSETIETRIKILKDSARDASASRRLIYNSMASELKLIEAKTILDGKEYPVDLSLIEDKPLASSPKGFDQHHQILIAFPQIQVGSEIYFKYTSRIKEVPIPGFFSTSMIYGTDALEKAGKVTVSSEIPLYVGVNDPDHVLQITKKTLPVDSPFPYLIQVQLTKPIIKVAVDESNVHLDPKTLPWVDISSSQDWAAMGRPMLDQYEKIFKQPLPPLFKKILNSARKKDGVLDQINTVTSMLASSINYLGDWRPVSGLYVPRNLAVIADTKLGDCKDFSASTAVILRQLGMNAHIAWIKRGFGAYESPNHLPVMSEFNHAIVHVRTPEKSIWIDPTNFSSFAHGSYPDISDRKALLIDSEHLQLERTPPLEPENAQVILTKSINFEEQDRFRVVGEIELKGSSSLPYTGIGLRASKQSIDYSVIKAMGDENRITDWKVDKSDLTSRIVHDLSFRFSFSEKNPDLKTTAGSAMMLSAGSYIPVLLTKTADRVSDLLLGTPIVVRREVQLDKISKLGAQSLDCSIQSSWLDASRKISDNSTGVSVVDLVTIKKSLISNSELYSSDYSKLQESLQKCFNGVAIVYTRTVANQLKP